jgi:hypothetical protein
MSFEEEHGFSAKSRIKPEEHKRKKTMEGMVHPKGKKEVLKAKKK